MAEARVYTTRVLSREWGLWERERAGESWGRREVLARTIGASPGGVCLRASRGSVVGSVGLGETWEGGRGREGGWGSDGGRDV